MEVLQSAPRIFLVKAVIIVSYVYELLVMAEDKFTLSSIKSKLANSLSETDMGLAVCVLGMKLVRREGFI